MKNSIEMILLSEHLRSCFFETNYYIDKNSVSKHEQKCLITLNKNTKNPVKCIVKIGIENGVIIGITHAGNLKITRRIHYEFRKNIDIDLIENYKIYDKNIITCEELFLPDISKNKKSYRELEIKNKNDNLIELTRLKIYKREINELFKKHRLK